MDQERSIYTPEFFLAWEKMAGSMENAFRYVGDGFEDGRPLALQQTRYVLASMALAQLFKDLGQQEYAANFHVLAEGLQDLVDGIPHPLFKVERSARRGRQGNTSAVWRIQASLCIGLRFMMAGGAAQSDAVASVIKKHKNSLKKLLRPGAELRTSISSWLKKFESDDVSNDVALSSYKTGISAIPDAKNKFSGEHLRLVGAKLVAAAAARADQLP